MAKRSALGKGLGAFFGEDVVRESEESTDRKGTGKQDNEGKSFENRSVHKSAPQKEISQEKEDKKQEENVSRETLVKITQIEPNREQPRKNFDQESMEELADSMKEYGVIQPLLVKKTGEDRYQIIAGERRWRAAKIAGLKEVPVIVREYDRQQSVEIALIENVQRADLNPIEEAMAYAQLMEEFGMKQEEIAFRVSKNRTTIANSLRLLKLQETVRNYLITGELSSGHARAILGLPEPEQQEELAKRVVEKGLSVREVEKLVKLMTKPPKEKKENSEDRDLSFIFRDLEERMKGIMGTKVMIHQKDKNKGRIEIEYYSASELERIVELIESIK